METPDIPRNNLFPIGLSFLFATVMAALLTLQGRIWWCKFGDSRIYVAEAWNSSHTSQHLLDPYTFTHVLHGVMFFWIAAALIPRAGAVWQITAAVAAESMWELLENSNFIIQKYRENTASLDYFGDSVGNSLGDVLACAVGFVVAQKLGWWKSLIFFMFVELALLLTIRDGLLLNILMLIYPLDAVKNWQMGM